MCIVIDARMISGQKTGDRTFALGILRGLAQTLADDGIEIVVVLQNQTGARLIPKHPAFRVEVQPGLPGPLWMPLTFPRLLSRLDADVALVNYLGPFRAPCPLVTVVHDVVWRALPHSFPARDRLLLDRFLPGTLRRAAAVVTVSEFSRGEIIKYFGVPRGKIHIVPNAADERFHPVEDAAEMAQLRDRYGLPEKFVLNLGVIHPRKNVNGLIRAYTALPEAVREQYGLVITGRHGWGEALPATLTGSVGPGSVCFTGYVPDEDLPALYSAATAFAYPSLYEGFGIPPLEAMACGTPVVASNVASLPDVVGDAALMVDPRSTESIRDGLEQILGDAELRARLREAGFERVKQFSWRSSAERMLAVLRSAARD